ncbi:hypothetical protein [Mycolicibacterium elephantis]|uniref:Uncharacterized protein n=1 Tax=Mycolicibacterium elephantis DSM 44368 TaxID=1335622 RepID=A0A439DVM1_9MYCO|nr:hypothetical protein [Mycolicibacterium elephantis]MCV7222869.1 hypothetical protein [Mycolicibacterium elephantis]RWA21134.1 hypothetical protein MELE44368_17160 [Mycolicibacterium elephantis DSM 44368]
MNRQREREWLAFRCGARDLGVSSFSMPHPRLRFRKQSRQNCTSTWRLHPGGVKAFAQTDTLRTRTRGRRL